MLSAVGNVAPLPIETTSSTLDERIGFCSGESKYPKLGLVDRNSSMSASGGWRPTAAVAVYPAGTNCSRPCSSSTFIKKVCVCVSKSVSQSDITRTRGKKRTWSRTRPAHSALLRLQTQTQTQNPAHPRSATATATSSPRSTSRSACSPLLAPAPFHQPYPHSDPASSPG